MMKNLSKYFCLSAIALGLWSCSKDDAVEAPIKTFEGQQALMEIRICTPSNLTRSDVDESDKDGKNQPNYENGTGKENKVESANFYFYDKAGDFVTSYKKAVVDTEFSAEDDDPLIEKIGKSQIVLTNLLGKNYPSYVITVLNYNVPENVKDEFEQSLNDVKKAVLKSNPWSANSFLMTTATHDKNSRNFWYFATPISEENFALQPDGSSAGKPWPDDANAGDDGQGNKISVKPIEVYVERLASKVQVDFPDYVLTEDNNYETFIKDPENKNSNRKFEIDGNEVELKVRIYGWGVNGSAKTERYMKAVNEGQTPFVSSDGWDFNGTNRCYWAKTPGYNSGNYPNDFSSVEVKSGTNLIYANSETLNYISWNDVKNNKFKKDADNIAYIMPHTEAGEQINLGGQIRHSAVTEILLAAEILDKDNNPVEIFEVSGTLYSLDGVKNYVLASAGTHMYAATEKRTVTVKNEDGEDEQKEVVVGYRTVNANDINLDYEYDGGFKFVLTDAAKSIDWWYRTLEEKTDASGNKYYELSNPYSDNLLVESEINSYLPEKQTWCYKDGKMYYNIPIRHLRPLPKATDTDKSIKTGMYGVVRNHWYKVSIGNITNIGHAVYRPNEDIIPPSDDTRYMIGSKINILSWRMVRQTAEL